MKCLVRADTEFNSCIVEGGELESERELFPAYQTDILQRRRNRMLIVWVEMGDQDGRGSNSHRRRFLEWGGLTW